ncbi:MAG: CopD family protein [Deltaproteobacteria bacterium]|nr:CopD family protein [Deltaproteobacteria bacterium]
MLFRISLVVHLAAVISWMAGLLYLIRLFVYHAQEKEEVVKDRFIVMERRLYKIITMPAMGAALLSGILLIAANAHYYLKAGWLHKKLVLVFIMIGVTHYAGALRRKFEAGTVQKSHVYFRVLNEVPTLLMILILILVVFKP